MIFLNILKQIGFSNYWLRIIQKKMYTIDFIFPKRRVP
jgi:hypothetical protein